MHTYTDVQTHMYMHAHTCAHSHKHTGTHLPQFVSKYCPMSTSAPFLLRIPSASPHVHSGSTYWWRNRPWCWLGFRSLDPKQGRNPSRGGAQFKAWPLHPLLSAPRTLRSTIPASSPWSFNLRGAPHSLTHPCGAWPIKCRPTEQKFLVLEPLYRWGH